MCITLLVSPYSKVSARFKPRVRGWGRTLLVLLSCRRVFHMCRRYAHHTERPNFQCSLLFSLACSLVRDLLLCPSPSSSILENLSWGGVRGLVATQRVDVLVRTSLSIGICINISISLYYEFSIFPIFFHIFLFFLPIVDRLQCNTRFAHKAPC